MSFKVGEIVVYCNFEHHTYKICEVIDVLYDCRIADGGSIRADTKHLQPATPEERAHFVAVQKQKLDKQIAELMAYRKQLEDGTTD
jgi:hypothetical protein